MPNEPTQKPDQVERPKSQVKQSLEIAYHGPVPPPAMLAAYNQVVPNGADRIMKMAESDLQHLHEMQRGKLDIERLNITGALRLQGRGQWMGFIIALTTIIGGFILVALGRNVEGMSLILTALGGLIASFLYARRLAEKAAPEKEPRITTPQS